MLFKHGVPALRRRPGTIVGGLQPGVVLDCPVFALKLLFNRLLDLYFFDISPVDT
jgi:hypothetical protein